VECKLIVVKSRVALKHKISIQRMELMGALLSVRLARKIQDSFTFKFKRTKYFTDSSVILGMLKCDSASFLEFVGTWVTGIQGGDKEIYDPCIRKLAHPGLESH
jgi:Pao retrotransposon peptidase